MSDFMLPPDKLEIKSSEGVLGLYQFDTKVAKHYFCKNCGIYPFHETMRKAGHYRVNLGCIDELDIFTFSVDVLDGKSI